MHVMPHSPLSATDVQTAGDAAQAYSIQQAASASQSGQRISASKLDQAASLYRTMNVLNCDPQDALTILFDFLNTGAEEGYTAVLKAAHATGNIPGPHAAAPARPSTSPLHSPASRPQLWEQRSWPEKVLHLKDGGAHASLHIGMMKAFFDEGKGPNSRGHDQLPDGCLAFFPIGRDDRADFKRSFYTNHFDPVLRSLGPNQAAVFAIPGGGTLLQGRDEHGEMFGFASGLGSASPRQTEVLRGHQLSENSAMFRCLPSGPVPWAILLPRGLEIDKR